MSHEHVATILSQLDSLAQVHAQHPHRAERLQEARSVSFKQRIDALAGALTDADAVLLSDAAELALGAHAPGVLDAIVNALSVVSPVDVHVQGNKTATKCHNLLNFPGFLTAGQWTRLTPSGNITAWQHALVECALQVGCVQPSEKTLKSMLAMIVWLTLGKGLAFPTVPKQLEIINSMKAYFPKRFDDADFVAPCRDFPKTFHQLTQSHRERAYNTSEMSGVPDARDIPELVVIFQRLKCRKSALQTMGYDVDNGIVNRKRALQLCDANDFAREGAVDLDSSRRTKIDLGGGRTMVISGTAKRRTDARPSSTIVPKRQSPDFDAGGDDIDDDAYAQPSLCNRRPPQVPPLALAPFQFRGGAHTHVPARADGRKRLDNVPGGTVPEKWRQRECAPAPSAAPSAAPSGAPHDAPDASPRPSASYDEAAAVLEASSILDNHLDVSPDNRLPYNLGGAIGAYVDPEQVDGGHALRTPKPSSSLREPPLHTPPFDRATQLSRAIESEAYSAIMRSKDAKAKVLKDKRATEAAERKSEREGKIAKDRAERDATIAKANAERAPPRAASRVRFMRKTADPSTPATPATPAATTRGVAAKTRLGHDKAYLDSLVLHGPVLSVTGEDNPRAELVADGTEANGTIIKRIHVKTTTKRGAGSTFETKLRMMEKLSNAAAPLEGRF
jgi:hypothetical protein